MYANFKLKFKEKQLRDIIWAATKSYVPDRFEAHMREMQAISPDAHAWLRAIPRNLWARYTFFPRSKAGNGVWEVTEPRKTYVALNGNSCSCNEWNLTRIACVHTTTAIVNDNKETSDFVHDLYTVNAYKMTYQHVIFAIPYDSGWVDTKSDLVGPLQIKKAPGRPKKLRRKRPNEEGATSNNRVSKKSIPMHCNHCIHTDHNVTGCKNIGCLYVRKRKHVQEQGAESSNSQDIDIGSNPNIGSLDGD
ncbi:hypothetical protein ACH5RR_001643 [Cinchona calisaya]|uniref:SWIM-type domain-containing protein n=1 Tax=Cinchona calisaya TaxID=153742 RepID=A0ABD3B3Z9_9GENT